MFRRKFYISISISIILVMVLGACAPQSEVTEEPVPVAETEVEEEAVDKLEEEPEEEVVVEEEEKDPITLGVMLPMTTNFALYGTPMFNGVQLAVDHQNAAGGINGHMIEVADEDAADTATTALNALNKVLESEPLALVGSILGFHMLPFREVVDEVQIPIISLSGTRGYTENDNRYVFRTAEFDGNSKPAMTQFIVEYLEAEKVGILVVNNEWGMSGADHVTATLRQRYDMEPTLVETYQTTDTDMSAQLLNLKNADVDVIASQGHPGDTALVMKQVKQLGIEIPLVACSVAQTSVNMDITEPEDVEGVYVQTYALPWDDPDPEISAWAQEYYERFDAIPDAYALAQYDGVMMLFEAMIKAEEKGNLTREGVTDEMWNIEYDGLITTYIADMEGNMMREYIIVKYGENKEAEILESYFVTTEETIYQLAD